MMATSVGVDTLESKSFHPGVTAGIILHVNVTLQREHGQERNDVIFQRDILAASNREMY
jgi:hypothetical protein